MTETLKAQFDEQGYVVLEGLFSPEEVRQLKEETGRVLDEVKRGGSGATVAHGVYVGMTAASALFKRAAAKPSLAAALKAIIGDHVVFLSDKVVFKDAKVDFGSPWHQDYSYWFGSHKYSVWIALDDATPENGCLQVVPGSHLFGAVEHGGITDDNGFDNRIDAASIDPSRVADLSAKKGTAIIFHDLLYHSSYPNVTGSDRVALISTYKDGTQQDPEYPWAKAAFAL